MGPKLGKKNSIDQNRSSSLETKCRIARMKVDNYSSSILNLKTALSTETLSLK